MSYKITFQTRWSDFDANKHMRHSAYNDYAAECRVRFLSENGFDMDVFEKGKFGPILFREETNFLREVKLGEDISIELFLEGVSEQGERFKFYHKIFRQDGVLAAEIRVFGAWIDLERRKLTTPPFEAMYVLNALEKTDNFETIPVKNM
jgi:acyl-CoA thioester hydrolase